MHAEAALRALADRELSAADWDRVGAYLGNLAQAIRATSPQGIESATLKLKHSGEYRLWPTWREPRRPESTLRNVSRIGPASSEMRDLINRTLHSLTELSKERSETILKPNANP
jgi:hypothetical protein